MVALDLAEWRLVVVDLEARRITAISRRGEGPGEYKEVSGLFAIGVDTTIVEDRQSARWLVMRGGELRGMVRVPGRGQRGPTIVGLARDRVVETVTHTAGRETGIPVMPMRENAESIAVVLYPRFTLGREVGLVGADTLRTLRGRFGGQRRIQRGEVNGGPHYYLLDSPLGVEEQAVVFPDGWIAYVLASPYRVEWRTAKGASVVGAPLPFVPRPVTEEMKRAAIRRLWPKRSLDVIRPSEYPGWPATLPPFPNEAALAAPDGQVIIERFSLPGDRVRRYDIVDRSGALTARLVLDERQRLLGFGKRTAYVAYKDDDDLEWLQRFDWP
ncbi:MAG: hypothetical protein IT359_14350 [Gemmatimonadaceae bacterium]|nr:hypothetical protein [Gemmatimonadaceae bacterium]